MDLAVMPMPDRPIVAITIRLLAGYAFEHPEYLGVAHVCDEAIGKGTAKRDGKALNDAFDEIGASHGSYAGRESFGFSCLCLPEFVPQAIELLAEMIRTPSFPQDACEVAVELTRQSLAALNDDPQDMVKKLIHRQAYGDPLGRHPLGENETLDRIGRDQILDHWRTFFRSTNMQCSITGAVEPDHIAELLDRVFAVFIPDPRSPGHAVGRPVPPSLRFKPGCRHHDKELEQEYIALCFPGSAVTDEDFPVEQVLVGVLSGGMSGRLFTEVREKQGLVYWVGAWSDHPRGTGVIHLGASTTPQRVDRTYSTLLREVNRLSEDLTEDEVKRAITGIVAQVQTRGDVSRSRASRMADDLFYYDRPIPIEEKIARIEAVTVNDIKQYLESHPRDQLSVVTLGPRKLEETQ
jgi:predicted Zn-dependent peptidase